MSDFLEIEAQVDDPEQRAQDHFRVAFGIFKSSRPRLQHSQRRFARSSGIREETEELQPSQSSLREC